MDMAVVDRSAITVTHKQPFIDWNNRIFPTMLIEKSVLGESTTYLIDQIFGDAEKVLRKHFKAIFELELEGICIDEDEWPAKRTFKMFNEWFSIEVSGWVVDLSTKKSLED